MRGHGGFALLGISGLQDIYDFSMVPETDVVAYQGDDIGRRLGKDIVEQGLHLDHDRVAGDQGQAVVKIVVGLGESDPIPDIVGFHHSRVGSLEVL